MRRIGIIGNGETDYQVFKKIAEILLSNEVKVIELRKQTLHDAVDKYWKDTRKNYSILQKAVKGILSTALSDFQLEIGETNVQRHSIVDRRCGKTFGFSQLTLK